ncbi:MAG TPA: radical SAM protein [Desulfobacteraceae bacterium]|nr:radical SAM protein [Desulfobacteraceae bacterium]
MAAKRKIIESYSGFEQGPIRPPSEANSLLIRVTRNCPWNRCKFCRAYREKKFSIRPLDHVIRDINSVAAHVETLRGIALQYGRLTQEQVNTAFKNIGKDQLEPYYAAVNWFAGGMESIFLQDGNSLVRKPEELIAILNHIKSSFPWIQRITSYARSHTVAKIKPDILESMGKAGLNRIHVGLESGSDEVLRNVNKGVTKELHIKAGLNIKKAGIELSEYVMPGLGGVKLSEVHARETADALNSINPDFIRIRTLAVPKGIELFDDYKAGIFKKCTDVMMAKETLFFIESLKDITSVIKSDHILNLFGDLEGTLPHDKERMVNMLQSFIDMDPQQQCLYQVGRRLGHFYGLQDMNDHYKLKKAETVCDEYGITPDNVEQVIEDMINRFI